LNSGERIETLTSLGLTLNQARAYLSLLQLGPVGAKELAESSKITRQDIYRVMLASKKKHSGKIDSYTYTVPSPAS